ncbi:putative membrane protein [Serratia marcescens]|nr:putative membrane protein [Serratia marcescens]AXK26062.1 Putative membrane protein [Serratia marcescens]
MVSVGETANNSIWGVFVIAAAHYGGTVQGSALAIIGT